MRPSAACSPPACRLCGRVLSPDEEAIYKRLVNRGATEFLCKACLAAHLGCPPARIEEKIRHFRAMGCTLFAPLETNAAPPANKDAP